MKGRRFFSGLVVLVVLLTSIVISSESYSYFQPVTSGDQYILLRFEDVGPGGFYGTPEGLGKLRAVIEYMQQQQIPYHITVVPRWKSYKQDTGWENVGIDNPTPHTKSFVKLLQNAQSHGAVLGMHGYSHQWGDSPRADGQENSGFAYEFDIKGEPASATADYAAERIEKSLQAFKQNGLFPAFWESPHYHATQAQEEVFRSYMGIIYEPDWWNLRSFRDVMYVENENTWKQTSEGSVYIPAPLRYIYDEDRVQEILNQLQSYHNLASMYFHPYIEFSYLEPELDNGKQVMRDGIPVFQYKSGNTSPLHKLVGGIKRTRFQFGTIFDVVPFSPAHRVQQIPHVEKQAILTGDLNNDGRDDWITTDSIAGKVTVTLSNLEWPRNIKTLEPQVWLQHQSLQEKNASMPVVNVKTKRSDLLVVNQNKVQLFANEGDHFSTLPINVSVDTRMQIQDLTKMKWVVEPVSRTANYEELPQKIVAIDSQANKGYVLRLKNSANSQTLSLDGTFELPSLPTRLSNEAQYFLGDTDGDSINDLIVFDPLQKRTWVMRGEGNSFLRANVWFNSVYGEQVAIGDTNGDGRADMVFYNKSAGIWQVARSTGSAFEKIPASFGPWARSKEGILLLGDWDGNGKSDIAVYGPARGTIDTALSYQR